MMNHQHDMQRSFRLFITHVDSDGPFLRLSGQLDKQSVIGIESLISSSRENFEKGVGSVPPAAILEGVICAAKYKDGNYYRAKIISTNNLSSGLVGVHFIDYGNKDIISLSSIRYLDNYDPLLLQIRGQASDYYLSSVIHPAAQWEEPILLRIQSLICYNEHPAIMKAQTPTLPIIAVQFQGNDLSEYLIANKYAHQVPLQKQEVLLQMAHEKGPSMPNWSPSVAPEQQNYTEHVPFLVNQVMPSNPASAMRLHQSIPPFNLGLVPPPSAISQRLLNTNKSVRTAVHVKTPIRHPQQQPQPVSPSAVPLPASPSKSVSPKKSSKTYKSRLLEVNTQYKAYVSYADEGPELFAVQLVADAKKFQDMMDEINRRPHKSLTEPPMIGTVCLGRMSGDKIICRAIVMNLSGTQCKLFFVDFGDTEMVSYYDIFDIPEEFVTPNVFAMRFCLSGVKNLQKGAYLNEMFKQLVNHKIVNLKVVKPEGPPLIQYGELHIDGTNVMEMLVNSTKDSVKFRWLEMLPAGSKQSVLVSYVDSCVKFYVQLSSMIDELNRVMEAVRVHCESSASPGELPVGSACCARFPDDDNWYRAWVISADGDKVTVMYVDYGNEQEVTVADLRIITPDLIQLPAQALKCSLKGFEDKPVESKTSNQLEMLALEKTLVANIIGVINDTMLVSLVDDTVTPPLDIARKMTQLSQPRILEHKPVSRKDSDLTSPEGDDKSKGYRREKSFKDDRRPHKDGDDFGQRGSSFRNRENSESFERTGPGRHSEKFGARNDRGDGRDRRGSKPWETTPPANNTGGGDDAWDESPQSPPYKARDTKKSKGEAEKGGKPWKKDDNTKKRDNLNFQKHSVQDRLKRKQDEWEDKKDDRGGRPDRRDNRRDNFERREPFNKRDDNRSERPFQKREFNKDFNRDDNRNRGFNRDENRDNNRNWDDNKKDFQKRDFRDKGDRNFNSRDKANRSFGSDDKKSDKSFNADRKPRYQKFTPVEKELTDPVSLDTPFADHAIEPNAQHEVSVTWIISPASFYTQILSHQPKFLEMMHRIPEMYKGVKPFSGNITEGSSVLARYPDDGVLYRATVVSVQPFGKFIVQYIDFGNKFLVDSRDIWQLDRQLLELPKMAVHCSLLGVAPKDGEWKANNDIDLCFNAPRYQCVYTDIEEGTYRVSLWNNGVSVADTLVEKELAAHAEQGGAVTLKDEEIDLTIIVGQQLLCKVTHIEDLNKFYVQLDLGAATQVENAIEAFDKNLLTPLTAETLSDGVHCTVKHEEKVYRAIVSDCSDTNNIKIVLPDYGRSITTTLDNIMILPQELSIYFYQSMICCLHQYTEESNKLMTVEDMRDKLLNKTCIIYINDIEEATLLTTLYDFESGKKVAIFEPDEGAYEEVVQLCARAVYNYNFGLAYISHVESLDEIYLQKASDTDRLAELIDNIYQYYEEGTPEELAAFEEGSLCAAKSSDGNWYRATIKDSTETECTVFFSDYGNAETVLKENVKKLATQFYEPCALALLVGLGLTAVDEQVATKLKEWTNEKELQVTLSFGTDGWLANLHLDGVDLSIKLVTEKLAAPQATSEEEEKQPETKQTTSPEGCTQVYISHVDSPGQFWLQMADKVDPIEIIQEELANNCDSYPDVEDRETGTICAAKYSADELWYRAEILDADADITTVRFIDYGNTDVLDNKPGLLKKLPEHLCGEALAVKASVNAVPTGTGQWSEAAAECFGQVLGEHSPVDALVVLKDVFTYVDLFVEGENVTDRLVAEGHATRSDAVEGGQWPNCFASHVNGPTEFWLQLASATQELQQVEASMADAEHFAPLETKDEGTLCAAKFPEDGLWYRAQVVADGSEGTEVLFMDYGNASIASELRTLPDELKAKPALSRKCALQKPRDVKCWSRKSEVKFNELAAEGATIFDVQFIASGDISIVELYLDGKSVTEELVGLCERTEEKPPTEDENPRFESGTICHVESLNEFYVHLDRLAGDMDSVVEKLVDAAEFEALPEIEIGSLCAAFWAEDDQWYRAKVISINEVGKTVLFMDYGNKSVCEEFRQLPEDLRLKPLAKCCKLSGTKDDTQFESSAEKRFKEIANEGSTFQFEFLDNSEPALVRIKLHEEDISDMIQIKLDKDVELIVHNAESEPVGEKSNTIVDNISNEKMENLHITDLAPNDERNPSAEIDLNSSNVSNKLSTSMDLESDELNLSKDSKKYCKLNVSTDKIRNKSCEIDSVADLNSSIPSINLNKSTENEEITDLDVSAESKLLNKSLDSVTKNVESLNKSQELKKSLNSSVEQVNKSLDKSIESINDNEINLSSDNINHSLSTENEDKQVELDKNNLSLPDSELTDKISEEIVSNEKTNEKDQNTSDELNISSDSFHTIAENDSIIINTENLKAEIDDIENKKVSEIIESVKSKEDAGYTSGADKSPDKE